MAVKVLRFVLGMCNFCHVVLYMLGDMAFVRTDIKCMHMSFIMLVHVTRPANILGLLIAICSYCPGLSYFTPPDTLYLILNTKPEIPLVS